MRPFISMLAIMIALAFTSTAEAHCGRPVARAAVRVATLPLRVVRVVRQRQPVRRFLATHKPVRRVLGRIACGPGGCR
jgi:hypothetical protein